MRLLNPFRGYLLASGHPLYHLVFFIGSFSVSWYGTGYEDVETSPDTTRSADEIIRYEEQKNTMQTIYWLRYAHLVVLLLAIISDLFNLTLEFEKLFGLAKEEPDEAATPKV